MTLQLPPDLLAVLTQVAAQAGATPDELAIAILRQQLTGNDARTPAPQSVPQPQQAPSAPPRTMLDALAPFIGCIDGPVEAWSHDTGRRFTDFLQEPAQAPRRHSP